MRIKKELTLIESPRDAWQGMEQFIPTSVKAGYIDTLLKSGFQIVEVGSFVSPKAIPQLSDTRQLIEMIDPSGSKSKIMVLTGNVKGAEIAMEYDLISYLSFPFSLSPTFLQKNLNTTTEDAFRTIDTIQNLCVRNNKEVIVYITMAFGNPYSDPWSISRLTEAVEKLIEKGITIISLTDILGDADPQTIEEVYDILYYEYRSIDFGLHLHAGRDWQEKIHAAYSNKCRMFDSVMHGYGGCPNTGHKLLGNVDTLKLLDYFQTRGEELTTVDFHALQHASGIAASLFRTYSIQ